MNINVAYKTFIIIPGNDHPRGGGGGGGYLGFQVTGMIEGLFWV